MKEILNMLLNVQIQTQILHWQTTSYARHMAFGGFYDAMSDLTDTLVEAYQGKYGRVFLESTNTIKVHDISDENLETLIKALAALLSEKLPALLEESDTDILNIRDEMLGQVNKLNYLLTLK
jgi:Family of unknown function (DUF5856)